VVRGVGGVRGRCKGRGWWGRGARGKVGDKVGRKKKVQLRGEGVGGSKIRGWVGAEKRS